MFDQNAGAPSSARTGRGLTFARLAALVGVGLLLAACGSSGNSGNAAGGGVATRDHPQLGTIMTSPAGGTLYFTDQEADGTIRCVDGCLSFWSPMVMSDSSPPTTVEGLGVTRRQDNGQNQLTYQGKPLYTFSQDSAAGQVTGDKVEDDFSGIHFVWHAVVLGAQPPGGGTQPPSETTGGGYGY